MALSDNLVSYWDFDTDADDAVGTNDGVVTNAHLETAKINDGYEFDGNSQNCKILISTASDITFSTVFSISLWMKLDTVSGEHNILDKRRSSASGYQIRTNGSSLELIYINSSGTERKWQISASLTTGTWYHLVWTFDEATMVCYLDGSSEATNSTNADESISTTNPNDLSFGRVVAISSDDYSTDGIIDEVGFWNKVLTSTEVTELYNSGSGLSYPFTTTTGTNLKINIGDAWKDVESIKINIGDAWKDVESIKINIGDAWKEI